jgi:hypothetical protein
MYRPHASSGASFLRNLQALIVGKALLQGLHRLEVPSLSEVRHLAASVALEKTAVAWPALVDTRQYFSALKC